MSTSSVERYPIKTDRHSSHSQIVDLCGIGAGRSVLDVGCARGYLGAALLSRGWDVSGIEPDASDADIARATGMRVTVAPAEDALSREHHKYDVIVFADVLEHLVDPARVLMSAKERLSPSGRMVISIPNVAHLTVRLQLLFGSFTYTDRGILDRTHLHFYTRKTLLTMLRECGLEVTQIRATPAPIEEVFPVLRRVPALRIFLEVGALLARLLKPVFAYQFVVVCETR